MRNIPLPAEVQLRSTLTNKLTLDYTDLLTWTSGTFQAIFPTNTLGSETNKAPANQVYGRFIINVKTAFTSSGGAITTLTFSVGDSGSATRYLNAIDLKTAGYTVSSNNLFVATTALTLRAVATIAGQTMASLNAGAIEVYFEKLDVTDLAAVVSP